MAAALFRRCCPDLGAAPSAESVTVESAGLLPGGFASPPEVVAVMQELDIDLSGHDSTQVSPEIVGRADMIVGMARRHAREVVLMDPVLWSRTYTLKELVRRGETAGPRAPAEEPSVWLERVHRGRQRIDLVGSSPDDDVPDPLGGSIAEFRATARQLADLVERVAELLWTSRSLRTRPG
jgi:protein-tyrosine phosphatase